MLAERQTTTSLIEIRDFLMTDGVAPDPWQPPTRSVEALYRHLRKKRPDDDYWARLKSLTRRMEGHQFSLSDASYFDALGRPTLDDVIDDLRLSLGNAKTNSNQNLRGWFGRSIGTTALAGFLFLGVCAGCDEDEGETYCEEAAAEGFSGDRAEIYCELVDLVQSADIGASVRSTLLECIPELDAAYRETILDSFQTMNDADLASFLNDLSWQEGPCFNAEDGH